MFIVLSFHLLAVWAAGARRLIALRWAKWRCVLRASQTAKPCSQ